MDTVLTSELLVLVPIVVGLVSAVKMLGMNTKYAPILSVILGVLGAIVVAGNAPVSLLGGIVVGLSASGLYSGTKATLQ